MAENRKPKPPPDDPEQSKRFIEAAKSTGATDGKEFIRAFKKVVHKTKRRR